MWHIKFLRILSELWICRSHSIWWKLDFCQLCNLTAGCNFNNQLLFTAFCSASVGWIKTNGVIYIPIVFYPLTVKITDFHVRTSWVQHVKVRSANVFTVKSSLQSELRSAWLSDVWAAHESKDSTSRYNGPKSNGNPPITNAELWLLQITSLYLLYWQ